VIYEQVFTDRPDALRSLSPEWMACVRFAASECARRGLTLDINAGSGYIAGGPCITPELGMQRLVASELQIQGGRTFAASLPLPPTKLGFYKDVAVLAYPSPAGNETVLDSPRYSSEPAGLDLGLLFDPEATKQVRISPVPGGRPVLIEIDYGRSFTARSLTYSQRHNSKALVIATQMPGNWSDDFYGQSMRLDPPIGGLDSSSNGATWEQVCELPAIGYLQDSWSQLTLALPARTARYFWLKLHGWGHNTSHNDDDLMIGAVQLRGDARIDHWEGKSGNVVDFSNPDRTSSYTGAEVIDPPPQRRCMGSLSSVRPSCSTIYVVKSRAVRIRSVFRPQFQLCPCHTTQERYNSSESAQKKKIPVIIAGKDGKVVPSTPGLTRVPWSSPARTSRNLSQSATPGTTMPKAAIYTTGMAYLQRRSALITGNSNRNCFLPRGFHENHTKTGFECTG
jgi:hypothetical protein